jgi:hypothetical protein
VDHFARLEHEFLVAHGHSDRAFFDDGDLIVGVVVQRNLVAFIETKVRHGDGGAVKGLAAGQRIQLLFGNVVPRIGLHGGILACRAARSGSTNGWHGWVLNRSGKIRSRQPRNPQIG